VEARKYTASSRVIEIQDRLTERAVELLNFPDDGVPRWGRLYTSRRIQLPPTAWKRLALASTLEPVRTCEVQWSRGCKPLLSQNASCVPLRRGCCWTWGAGRGSAVGRCTLNSVDP
jgi:hypothetical protein